MPTFELCVAAPLQAAAGLAPSSASTAAAAGSVRSGCLHHSVRHVASGQVVAAWPPPLTSSGGGGAHSDSTGIEEKGEEKDEQEELAQASAFQQARALSRAWPCGLEVEALWLVLVVMTEVVGHGAAP
jgi:hypothetical protein